MENIFTLRADDIPNTVGRQHDSVRGDTLRVSGGDSSNPTEAKNEACDA